MNENHTLAIVAINITTRLEIVTVSVRAMVLFFDEESATFTRRALPYLIDEFTYLEPLTYLVLLSLCHSSYQLEEEHPHRMPPRGSYLWSDAWLLALFCVFFYLVKQFHLLCSC